MFTNFHVHVCLTGYGPSQPTTGSAQLDAEIQAVLLPAMSVSDDDEEEYLHEDLQYDEDQEAEDEEDGAGGELDEDGDVQGAAGDEISVPNSGDETINRKDDEHGGNHAAPPPAPIPDPPDEALVENDAIFMNPEVKKEQKMWSGVSFEVVSIFCTVRFHFKLIFSHTTA